MVGHADYLKSEVNFIVIFVLAGTDALQASVSWPLFNRVASNIFFMSTMQRPLSLSARSSGRKSMLAIC